MRRLSIARLLLLALVGMTVSLAVLAALEVAALYDARQDYEDVLARSYSGEVAAANLLTASVVEESIAERGPKSARQRAAAAFDRAATAAREAAEDDGGESLTLIETAVAAEARLRAAGTSPTAGREALAAFARRQGDRRARARDRASDRTHRAVVTALIAGGLAVGAAIALVVLLVGGLRRPLSGLVGASRRLASGDLDARVDPDGPAELRELSSAFNAMAADLDASHARIESGRRRLAATIESLGDALVICDGYGRVLERNPRAEVLLPTVQVGDSIAASPGPLPPLEEVLDDEVEVEDASGRTLAVTAARMGPRLEDGVVFTVRDTTERARLERAKSEFVATASHELRSPLTSIKGFVELLGQTDLNPRQREFADVILLSTNRLVDLVNDLLDVARVEAGQLEIQRRPISVAEAVREVAAMMAPQFADRRQELVVEIAPALPVALADPARVRQIVTNLLTNAHLYTGEGGKVTIRVGATGDDVLIVVSDQGLGMSSEQVDRVFDRFFRADGSRGTGTGLGLSIVQSLVELHDGSIDIQSELEHGTTVTVRLPRARSAADVEAPREALQGRRVLVIEDDAETARLIASQLTELGVDARTAADGEEALALLRRERFDAVTLDILLGDDRMDGFAVLNQIRGDETLSIMPVIVVSAIAGQEALAAEWSVAKPIDADELSDAIGSAILAGRARVLVVGRAAMRDIVGPLLDHRGVEYAWATSGAEARRMCEETHFEVALVDAGMRAPHAALTQLDLRGRRLRRSVVVFSADGAAGGMARLDPSPVSLEDAAQAVVEALRGGASTPAER
jgi:signal transduction histidine kinase/DNA-binding response OmpR family regulator